MRVSTLRTCTDTMKSEMVKIPSVGKLKGWHPQTGLDLNPGSENTSCVQDPVESWVLVGAQVVSLKLGLTMAAIWESYGED